MAETAEQLEFDLGVIGNTGLRRSSGVVYEEWHPKLRTLRQAIRNYQEMSDNDPVIGALLFAIENLLRQVEFSIVPSGDTDQHKEEAEFVSGALFEDMSMTWQDLLSETLSMLRFGFAPFEEVYKLRLGDNLDSTKRSKFNDGRIGWRRIAIRSQDTLDRWAFDDEGGLQGMWQIALPSYKRVFIPIQKMLLFRTKSHKNNPEGRSMLRNSWRPWWFKKRFEELRGIGIEKDLVGVGDLQVPPHIMHPEADAKDKMLRNTLEKMGQQLFTGERSFMMRPSTIDQDGNPTGFDFGLIKSAGQSKININEAIEYYDKRILTSVLAQFLLLGQDGVGSFALADSQTSIFATSIGTILKSITDVYNRFGIPRIEKLNSVPSEFWPKMVHGDIEKPRLKEFSDYVSALVNSGVISPDDKLEAKMRELGGLPAEGEE